MEMRPLGSTGVSVSALCLGGMNFGNRTDPDTSASIVERAVEAGINFIDTANRYGEGGPGGAGESERIIGRALAETGTRDQVVVATKFHFQMDPDDPGSGGVSRPAVLRAVEGSLERLQTDRIDLYQAHRDDPTVPIEETLGALAELMKRGVVLHPGSGFNRAWRFVESLWVADRSGLPRFVSIQPMYSLLVRSAEREFIPMAQHFDVAVMAHSPLNGGFFSGKIASASRSVDGSRFASWGWDELLSEAAWEVLAEVEELARVKDCSVPQLALAWVLGQPGVSSAIIGPATIEHLEHALEATEVELDGDDHARLDRVARPATNTWGG